MVHESLRNLRLDKRLLRRRGWLTPQELESELEQLPDVAAKAELVAPEEGESPQSPRGGDTQGA